MTHRHAVVPTIALAAALVLTGCGEDNTPAADPTAPPTSASPAASASATPSTSVSPTPAAPVGTTFTVAYSGGALTGDSGRVQAKLNDTVNIVVTSDVADEIHLHGYDVSVDVTPGTPATLTFQATIPGIFEVELEKLGKQLLSLQVG